MTVKREVQWGVVYPYAPDYVHPFIDRESAELHVESTGSTLVKSEWVEVAAEPDVSEEACRG